MLLSALYVLLSKVMLCIIMQLLYENKHLVDIRRSYCRTMSYLLANKILSWQIKWEIKIPFHYNYTEDDICQTKRKTLKKTTFCFLGVVLLKGIFRMKATVRYKASGYVLLPFAFCWFLICHIIFKWKWVKA